MTEIARSKLLAPCQNDCDMPHFHVEVGDRDYANLYGQLFAWNWFDRRSAVHSPAVDEPSANGEDSVNG